MHTHAHTQVVHERALCVLHNLICAQHLLLSHAGAHTGGACPATLPLAPPVSPAATGDPHGTCFGLARTVYIYIYAQLRFLCSLAHMHRVGQNRIYTPHVTVYLVFFLPELPYIHRIYMYGFGPPYTFLNHHQHVCILERARTPPMFEFDTHEHLRFPFKPGSHR